MSYDVVDGKSAMQIFETYDFVYREKMETREEYEKQCKQAEEFLSKPLPECPVPIYKLMEYIRKHNLHGVGVDLTDEALVKRINEEIPDWV